ncbi:hypothetical protein DEMA109039_05490 [Deinococcus marmoris]
MGQRAKELTQDRSDFPNSSEFVQVKHFYFLR